MPSLNRIKRETARISRLLETTLFSECLPLEKGFKNLSFHAGIYALKSVENEILYVGKASAFRTRFQNGHHILNQMFLDGLAPENVRVVTIPVTARYLDSLLAIEKGLTFALQPRYNSRIPLSEVSAMQQAKSITSGHIKDILRYLPDPVVEALEDHADAYGLTDSQVLELAIAQFLNLDAVSFGEIEQFKGLGALKEENAILRAKLKALGHPED